MTHEFKKIIHEYQHAKEGGIKAVLATVVDLDGSSYRRPGVSMLLLENDKRVGAVSGGCVEKEVVLQAKSVFKTNVPKMITYDGRYRLGCEGILYILLEPFYPNDPFLETFANCLTKRNPFSLYSYYKKREGEFTGLGTIIDFGNGKQFPVQHNFDATPMQKGELQVLKQEMKPCFQLMIIGTEHDAVQLCSMASLAGWEVTVIATPLEEKNIFDFPSAYAFINASPEDLDPDSIDVQTAVVVMTHSYAKDLSYLLKLKDTNPIYLGLLGPSKRRERLLNDLLEHCPEVAHSFFDKIHGPAGLHIGAETPQEIAIAIMAEILAVTRNKEPIMLKDKRGGIHT
ncbi:XdhC family protein [Sediminicola sp. 1XM1-17]|uniref:XdhC family protein n=1 Tax=Sediminicola sp. 1XM1-17 TaxID=3127702 RepID=UPI00307726FC